MRYINLHFTYLLTSKNLPRNVGVMVQKSGTFFMAHTMITHGIISETKQNKTKQTSTSTYYYDSAIVMACTNSACIMTYFSVPANADITLHMSLNKPHQTKYNDMICICRKR